MGVIPGLARPIMGRLNAHTFLRVGQHNRGRQFRVHLIHILLEIADHARFDDVDKRQNAGLGLIDDRAFEVEKVFGPGRAGINYRGHSGPE